MPKPATRTYSRYSREAAKLLGLAIRQGRIERQLTLEELAERAGISRGLLQRIERGDMGCAIGPVFETAAIVGIRLFDADQADLTRRIATTEKTLALLPHAVHPSKSGVKDDF
ncbi:MAG: helix-turn-helix domain-containing protein [Dehalococcoidia bacterium]